MRTSLGVVMRIVIELSCWPDTKSRVFQQPASAPRGARRRSPSPRPGAPPATPGWWSARAGQPPRHRAVLVGSRRDRRAPPAEAAPRAEAARPGGGTGARRRAVDRPGSPLRERRGGGGDTARRDSRAWWGPLGPSDGCDGPGRTALRSPGTDSRGLDGEALSATPAESCVSGPRPPAGARLRRGASRPGSRRTPGAGTFPRKRVCHPRGVHPWSETEKQVKVLRGRSDARTTISDLQARVQGGGRAPDRGG